MSHPKWLLYIDRLASLTSVVRDSSCECVNMQIMEFEPLYIFIISFVLWCFQTVTVGNSSVVEVNYYIFEMIIVSCQNAKLVGLMSL
jgi:hypothetical protein